MTTTHRTVHPRPRPPATGRHPARVARHAAPSRGGRARRAARRVGRACCSAPRCSTWGLGASGWANEFYSAAVQAGTQSWKAFFFGSLDSGNAITVDKPPLSLWPMELSGRIFGFNSWSMLVPQALEGVASVWLLHATVKRWFGHWAGLLAGALLALDAGRGADVPVQQPGRADGPAHRRWRRTARRAPSRRPRRAGCSVAGAVMGFVVPGEGAAAVHACSRRSPRVPRRRADLAAASAAAAARRGRRRRRRRGLVGARRPAHAGRRSSVHRRVGEQLRPRTRLRLQRPLAPVGRSGAGGGGGCGFDGSTGIGRHVQLAQRRSDRVAAARRARRDRRAVRAHPRACRGPITPAPRRSSGVAG